jgi:molybdopterin biosynthesis enzyme
VAELDQLLVHGIAIRRPSVILGMIGPDTRQMVLLRDPGYPVSAATTCELVIRPLLAMAQADAENAPR